MQRVPAQFHIDMLQPIPVATNWGAFGFGVWLVLMLTLTAATAVYVALLAALARDTLKFGVSSIVFVSAIAIGVLWTFEPLFSSDPYAYAAYGEMARLGINPYAAPVSHSNDAVVTAAIWQWSGTLPVCVYGELFVRIAQAVVSLLHGFSVRVQIDGLRILSSLALPVSAVLLGAIRSNERKRRYTVALLAWNPVLLWCAAEGHNDAVMLAVALGGIVVARRRLLLGMLVAAMAAAIKIPAAVVPAAIAYARARRDDNWVYAITYTIFVAAVIYAISHRWFDAVTSHVAAHGHYAPYASLQGLTTSLFGIPVGIVVAIVVAAACLFWAVRRGSTASLGIAVALTLWLLIPNPYAWYAFWIAPIFAWLPDSRAHYAAAGLTLSAMLRYVPDAAGPPSAPGNIALSLAAIALFAVSWALAASRKNVPLL